MKISLEEAAKLLMKGNVVAVPTETVYGLAASLNQEEAIKKIFLIKNRPSNNPLIIHLSDATEIKYFINETPPPFLMNSQKNFGLAL